MKTRLKPPVISEAQILKNRYDEARAIKEAWDYRLTVAQLNLTDARNGGGNVLAAQRTLKAVEVQVADAAGELRVALTAWMNHSIPHESRAA